MNDEALAEARLRELPGGAEALDRIAHLERTWGQRLALAPLVGPDAGAALDVDVIFAGGGLWLTLAPYLARRGLRVAVIERRRAGTGHREWNISGPELPALEHSGLFDSGEVAALIAARYDHGVCRWHEGGTWPVRGVLDHAIDAGRYLAAIRQKAEDAGVRILDEHAVDGLGVGAGGVRVRARGASGAVELTGRVLVDALGSASPHARVDLGCPTVGGVLTGLARGQAPDEVNPTVGDILVTTEHREQGRQHIWEGFPGDTGQLTTYLFYYARADALPERSLLSLYGRFFRLLPRYKRGDARVERLTYGIIPGWSRLGAPPRPPSDRVLLVGDAAARHSPLTFCGFGSMVRSFASIGDGLVRAIEQGDLSAASLDALQPDLPLLHGVGLLAFLMAEPRAGLFGGDAPATTNRLLDAAFGGLFQGGNAMYASLLRDEMSLPDFTRFLYRTSRLRPGVYTDVWRYAGPGEVGRWALGLMRGALSPG